MSSKRREALEQAFTELLRASGHRAIGEFSDTPRRAAELWDTHLLRGTSEGLASALGEVIEDATHTEPVSMLDMGVHMVCPHHLTVSFGHAHVAYLPAGKIIGFGALAELVERATGRLVLQEQATGDIARALHAHLDARATVAAIEATHPCHNIPHARSHAARALTWASCGDLATVSELKQLVLAGIRQGPAGAQR